MEFKLNIGDPKSKRTVKKILAEADTKLLIGKKIGQTVKGDALGFPGYEFMITGGSDYCGFPMRKDVSGIARKRILITKSVGNRIDLRKGLRLRRNVAGDTIYSKTAQVNLKVVTHGSVPLEEKKAEEKPEDKKEE
ncbi:30S ribosomal protein S6e [Candidatus Woesearchaeota archaeon]|nr:MAG: 30S ribosomal protein S6e [Candidatus Woesearchaeota archaeon]